MSDPPAAAGAPGEPLDQLIEKWHKDADESTAFADADEGAAPHDNVVHARGMAMAFAVCAEELEALRAAGAAQQEQIHESTDGRSMVADAGGDRSALSDAGRTCGGRGAPDALDRSGIAVGAARPQPPELEAIRTLCLDAGMDEQSTTYDYLRGVFYLLKKNLAAGDARRPQLQSDNQEDRTPSRVAPLVDCVAPIGSTAERPTGAVTAAERTEPI